MSIDNREAVTALSNEVWTRALGSCCGREVARVDEVDLTGRCMPSGAAAHPDFREELDQAAHVIWRMGY
jgi:hypothetical protein